MGTFSLFRKKSICTYFGSSLFGNLLPGVQKGRLFCAIEPTIPIWCLLSRIWHHNWPCGALSVQKSRCINSQHALARSLLGFLPMTPVNRQILLATMTMPSLPVRKVIWIEAAANWGCEQQQIGTKRMLFRPPRGTKICLFHARRPCPFSKIWHHSS